MTSPPASLRLRVDPGQRDRDRRAVERLERALVQREARTRRVPPPSAREECGERELEVPERVRRLHASSIRGRWSAEGQERQLNIHIDPQYLGGVYANFANVSFSDYEFTITFARIDHEVEEGDIPGVVVSRVNMSTRFMKELLDAMQDSWSKWSAREGIRNLPEAPQASERPPDEPTP